MVFNFNTDGDHSPTDQSDLFIPGFDEFYRCRDDPVLDFDSLEDWIFDLDSIPTDTDGFGSIPIHAYGIEVEKADGSVPIEDKCGSFAEVRREIGTGSAGPDGSDLKMAGDGISEETHQGNGIESAICSHEVDKRMAETDREIGEQDRSDSTKETVEFRVLGPSTEVGINKISVVDGQGRDSCKEKGKSKNCDGSGGVNVPDKVVNLESNSNKKSDVESGMIVIGRDGSRGSSCSTREGKKQKDYNKKMEEDDDLEEGEIRESDGQEMVLRGDEDGRVIEIRVNARNKQEIPPPVPLVDVVLKPHHQTVHVGVILSMTGTKIIVKGKEKHDWLAEGSILWVTETRAPLGPISEILGPDRNPYYIIRFNSKKDAPAGIRQGTAVSFVAEFANCILNERKIYKKSYSASSEDQSPNDGKGAEFKKIQQMEKRGKDNWTQGNQQSAGWNKVQVKERFHRKAQPSALPSQGCVEGPVGVGQRLFPDQGQQLPHAVPSGSGCYACSHGVGQIGIDGAPVSLMVQPAGHPEGLPHQLMPQVNVVSSNGMPIQQQHICPPTGFISNEMTYLQQHIYPPSGFMMNRMAHQQRHLYPYQQQHVCPPNVFAINGMHQQELDHHQHQMFSAFPNEMPIQSQFNPTQMPPFGDLVGPTPRAMSCDHLHHMRFGMGSQHQGHHAYPYGGMDEQGHSKIGQFPPSSTVQGGFSEPQQFNHRSSSNQGRRWPRRHSRWNFIGRRH